MSSTAGSGDGSKSDQGSDDENRKRKDRRIQQEPGPPYEDNAGDLVDEDRRLRPDPRLDRLIEADWGDEDSGSAAPEKED